MGADIRVCISLSKHRKYKKLKRLILCEPMLHLIVFWGAVAEQAPLGTLTGWSESDIADAADWEGEALDFCQAMIDAGFLDKIDGVFSPHDWAEHQPWVVDAPNRAKAASIAGKASAEARRNKARSNGK